VRHGFRIGRTTETFGNSGICRRREAEGRGKEKVPSVNACPAGTTLFVQVAGEQWMERERERDISSRTSTRPPNNYYLLCQTIGR
jgi:hypothetical protein